MVWIDTKIVPNEKLTKISNIRITANSRESPNESKYVSFKPQNTKKLKIIIIRVNL
jgi:hypothetical protein